MATCYTNFPAVINYSDGTSGVMYGTDVSIDESLSLQTAESLGVKGSSAVYASAVPQGTISINGYLTDSLSDLMNLQGSNDQNIDLWVGPYRAPTPCIMTSMSVNIKVGEPVTCSREFSFFGYVSTPSAGAPTPIDSGIKAAIPQNISLSGYSGISGSDIIEGIDWQFSQQYESIHLLGSGIPTVIFSDGNVSLGVQGETLTSQLTSGYVSGVCLVPPSDYAVSISGCNGGAEDVLWVSGGYMQSRSLSIEPKSPTSSSVSIIKYL